MEIKAKEERHWCSDECGCEKTTNDMKQDKQIEKLVEELQGLLAYDDGGPDWQDPEALKLLRPAEIIPKIKEALLKAKQIGVEEERERTEQVIVKTFREKPMPSQQVILKAIAQKD